MFTYFFCPIIDLVLFLSSSFFEFCLYFFSVDSKESVTLTKLNETSLMCKESSQCQPVDFNEMKKNSDNLQSTDLIKINEDIVNDKKRKLVLNEDQKLGSNVLRSSRSKYAKQTRTKSNSNLVSYTSTDDEFDKERCSKSSIKHDRLSKDGKSSVSSI